MLEIEIKKEDFKIVQITDLHISWVIDDNISRALENICKSENPSLIIFTGDVFHRLHTEQQSLELISDFIKMVDHFKVKYMFCFGNHDSELMLTKPQIYNKFLSESSYFIGEVGLEKLTRFHLNDSKYRDPRIGNCWLNVTSEGKVFSQICLLDSGRYNNQGNEGSLTLDQKRFVANSFQREQGPLLIFFHIPLQQFKTNYDLGRTSGLMRENVCFQAEDCGLFEWAIEQRETIFINCGHDHLNDYEITCANVQLNATSGLCFEEYNEELVRGYRVFTWDDDQIKTVNKYLVNLQSKVAEGATTSIDN